MDENREKQKQKKKTGAWLSAIIMVILMGSYGVFLLFALMVEPDLFLTGLFLWLLIPLISVCGVLAALRMRLKEIDEGEEDDAAQY